MRKGILQGRVLDGSVKEYFQLKKLIASTFSAEAYTAIDGTSREEVVVWITRGSIVRSDTLRFSQRLEKLAGVLKNPSIEQFGVDRANVGYAVMPAFTANSIGWNTNTSEDLESRFLDCLALVETLHSKAISCGDLCPESFVVNDKGEVGLFTVLGDVRIEKSGQMSIPSSYRRFRPQEQNTGELPDASVDVYALVWIAADIFTSTKGGEARKEVTPPRWLKTVLKATSSPEGRREMSSAVALRIAIEEARENGDADPSDTEGAIDFALVKVPGQEKEGDNLESSNANGEAESSEDGKSRSAPRSWAEWAAWCFNRVRDSTSRSTFLFALNILALSALLFSFISAPVPEMPTIEVVSKVELSDTKAIAHLINSDGPEAHEAIVTELRGSTDSSRLEILGRGVLQRSRRLGLQRLSDISRTYVVRNGGYESLRGPVGAELLTLLNPAQSLDGLLERVGALYGRDPKLGIITAASLALDTGRTETFWGIFARAAADQFGVADATEFSPVALMLLLPESRDLYMEDLLQMTNQLSARDVSMLLSQLGKSGSGDVTLIAALARRRNVIEGAHAVFLHELEVNSSVDSIVRAALVSGALGQLTEAQVRVFGNWYGASATRALQASIITASDSTVGNAAFALLRSRPMSDEYGAKIFDFVQSTYNEESSAYAKVVAAVALRDVLDQGVLRGNLQGLHAVPRLKELLRRMVRGAPADLVEVVLDLYEREIDPVDTIDLLSNPDRRIRLAALSHLSHVNDVLLLKLIRQAYDEEKDSDVRKAYREKIAVIADLFGATQES